MEWPSIWNIPGAVALGKVVSDILVKRFDQRISRLELRGERLEQNQMEFQTKVDANIEKKELRDDIQALRIEMSAQDTRINSKLDTVIGALLHGKNRV